MSVQFDPNNTYANLNVDGNFNVKATPDASSGSSTTQSVNPPPASDQTGQNAGVRNDIPKLSGDGTKSVDFDKVLYAMPSFGGVALAKIGEVANEERRVVAQSSFEESMAIADNIHEQATIERKQGTAKAVMQGISAGISGVASFATIASSASAIKGSAAVAAEKGNDFAASLMQVQSTKGRATSDAISGLAGVVNAASEAVDSAYEATQKELDAENERARALQSTLDSLKESLEEVIEKSRNVQQSMAENTNQTRTHILA